MDTGASTRGFWIKFHIFIEYDPEEMRGLSGLGPEYRALMSAWCSFFRTGYFGGIARLTSMVFHD